MSVPSRPPPPPRLVEGGLFDGLDECELDAFAAAMVGLLISAARRRGLLPDDDATEPPTIRRFPSRRG